MVAQKRNKCAIACKLTFQKVGEAQMAESGDCQRGYWIIADLSADGLAASRVYWQWPGVRKF